MVLFLKKNKFFLFFLFIVLFYALYYSPFGYEDTDNGFTLAQSWRIHQGEFPYKDFISVRPPISPILHSLILFIVPDDLQMLFDRFFCYLLFGISALVATLALFKNNWFDDLNINHFLFATISFIFSVHHFPPMAWHTVDAIFFASIGAYLLLVYTSISSVILGILFLFLAALCKQPFYILPFLGVALIGYIHKDKRKLFVAFFTLLSCIGVFIGILYNSNALSNFASYTFGATKLNDLIEAGFKSYTKINFKELFTVAGIFILYNLIFSKRKIFANPGFIPYILVSVLLIVPLFDMCYQLFSGTLPDNYYFSDNAAKLFFVLAVVVLLSRVSLNQKWLTLFFLLAISWCASISWGYQTPVLFSAPLLFGFLYSARVFFKTKNISALAMYTFLLGFISYFFAYQKPYRNPIRQELSHDISHLFPKMKHIRVGKFTKDKYTELSFLVKKYGNNFTTLPGMPLVHFLTNTNSPIASDWPMNVETGNQNNSILNELKRKGVIVFVERQPITGINETDAPFNSTVAYNVTRSFNKIDSLTYFDVYKFDNRFNQ
jgi:hypothetical protein